MEMIVKMKFGSHLYGTSTPASDMDFKGIFMPSIDDILLQRVPKSINTKTKKGEGKNSADDVDTEIYSLHYFIELACQGQTVALDMLHVPETMLIESTGIWDEIVSKRHLFYTRNLSAFVGYARRQASKYGIKGSRLNDAKRVLDFLRSVNPDCTLLEVWDLLPTGEHLFRHPPNVAHGLREYEFCGRKVQETATVGYTIPIVEKFYQNYGARAKQAADNEGIDWKAISHALRAAYQVKEILTAKTITFPLKEAPFLIQVKKGMLDYSTVVAPALEALMDEVERLSEKSDLPEKVDRKTWEGFLKSVLIGRFRGR